MPPRNITVWKRTKLQLEVRIQDLEAVRKEARKWISNSAESEEFGKYYHRISSLQQETAKKLDLAKQELREVNSEISEHRQRTQRTQKTKLLPIAIVMALIVMVGLSTLIIEPTITGLVIGENITVVENVSEEVPVVENVTAKYNLAVGSSSAMFKVVGEELILPEIAVGKNQTIYIISLSLFLFSLLILISIVILKNKKRL